MMPDHVRLNQQHCVCVRPFGAADRIRREDDNLRTAVLEVIVCDLDHRTRLAGAGAVHDEHSWVGEAARPAHVRNGLLVRLKPRLTRLRDPLSG